MKRLPANRWPVPNDVDLKGRCGSTEEGRERSRGSGPSITRVVNVRSALSTGRDCVKPERRPMADFQGLTRIRCPFLPPAERAGAVMAKGFIPIT